MSLLNILLNRSKVNAAVKKTARARKREGDVAEQLFKEAFESFNEVVCSDPVIADALYHWGFGLFHLAQSKAGEEADNIYREAGEKFAFCMTMNPQHLGAAIDWGATLMEQARSKVGDAQEQLYDLAREKFFAANTIQAGTASYNLACIHAIRGELQACQAALEEARAHGSLPSIGAILNDADMANIQHLQWFKEFIESVQEQLAASQNQPVGEGAAQAAEKKPEAAPAPEEKAAVSEQPAEINEKRQEAPPIEIAAPEEAKPQSVGEENSIEAQQTPENASGDAG